MRDYLSHATSYDDCPEEVYLWLADLHNREEVEHKAAFLEDALSKFPNSFEVRQRLASIYISHLNAFHKALDALDDEIGEFPEEAKWYRFEALTALGRYDDAMMCLDSIETSDRITLARVKADLLFKQGKLEQWLVYSEQSPDTDNIVVAIKKCFKKAFVNLQSSDVKEAVQDFLDGAKQILIYQDRDISCQTYPRIGNELFVYDEFDVILDVCESILLLHQDTDIITDEVIGYLAYIVYKLYGSEPDAQEDLRALLSHDTRSWLLLAAELLNDLPRACFESDFVRS